MGEGRSPWEGFGDFWRGLGALEARREALEYKWGSLEGFVSLGVLRHAQGVLGVTGVVLRVSERLFGIPRERFGVEGGWCGSGHPRRDLAVQESRGDLHMVWEAIMLVKVEESWGRTDRDPRYPP